MSDWSVKELEEWDERVCNVAADFGLDWYPINYDICDYYEMIGHMSYHGLPSHYDHWSYGKSFERTHQMYNHGQSGLPYELIINSNPSIAYLMKENPLYLQILIMAHCVGHSDFFKNNLTFKDTRADSAVSRFRNSKKRIKSYMEDPSIGIDKVECLLDNLHSIKYQVNRTSVERISYSDVRDELSERLKSGDDIGVDINQIPLRREYDLLAFFMEQGKSFSDWELDVINIVRDESLYFIPQIKTKVMNEGWASYWHYTIMNELKLPSELHLPFIKSHNQVIRPHIGGINPYHLGFEMFQKLDKDLGRDEIFFIREVFHDESFLRNYLEIDQMIDLNLFSYAKDTKRKAYVIDNVSDEDGWKVVKNDLINQTGIGGIPKMFVEALEPSGTLILGHDHDGRDLELNYANVVVNNVAKIWGDVVKLDTIIEEEPWEI
jgi:stage V sporulation protein R